MFLPRTKTATETILSNYSIYHLARLKADPRTQSLVSRFARAHLELRKARARERDAHEALVVAGAIRDKADLFASDTIGRFHLAVLSAVDNNRKSRAYTLLFPHGVTPVQEASAGRRLDMLRRLATVASVDGNPSELSMWPDSLTAAADELQKQLKQVSEADNRHHAAHTAEVAQRGAWRNAYQVSYAGVIRAYPGRRRTVESFFRAGPKKKRTEEPATPDHA